MKWPFKGNFKITQKFGVNPDAYAKFGLKGHNGIDHAVPTGTPLFAMIYGTVIEATNDVKGYGNFVKIENDKEGALVGHLSKIFCDVGSVVVEGQTAIGFSGNSGNSTGPHTHTGYYKKPRDRSNGYNGYIDPTPYITPENPPEVTTAPSGTNYQSIEQIIIDGYLALAGEGPTDDEKKFRIDTWQNTTDFLKSLTGDGRFQKLFIDPVVKEREDEILRLKETIQKTYEEDTDFGDQLHQAQKDLEETKRLLGMANDEIELLKKKLKGGENMAQVQKEIYQSSTLWLNLVGFVIIGLQFLNQLQLPVNAETQALILTVLNFLNRFRTNTGVKVA